MTAARNLPAADYRKYPLPAVYLSDMSSTVRHEKPASLTPFHAIYKARKLSGYAYGRDRLVPVFASSDIRVYPYQIAAAQFALRSPHLKGVILCDEGSLGKTYEALLAVTQLWYEGKTAILLVVPTPLLGQWSGVLENSFTVPFQSIDSAAAFDELTAAGFENPFRQDGYILTTYDFAAAKADEIARIQWDVAVFEEAHHVRRLHTGANTTAVALRDAVGDAFKILLTATPMQNSIMDVYGLIRFIDDSVFPDEEQFYQRYFRKPENYPELAGRVSKFCFRTTRPEVETYVKIPQRIPATAEYTLSGKEERLYELLSAYVEREAKAAFPKMDAYDLALMLFRAFSSSTFALGKLLRGVVRRMESLHRADEANRLVAAELAELRQMQALAADIKQNAKAKELLVGLKQGFARLKQLGARQKALIFTENRTTQDFLFNLLDSGPYKGKVLVYNGSRTRDYSIMERFEKDAKILIATDIAAEGFNLEFCSFVVNYDLPYNTLTIEQRINRCHRQGQKSDVVILNFLNKNNFADVRMLQLINKRILQFSGVFGLTGDVIGNFGVDLGRNFSKLLGKARSREEIDRAYNATLSDCERENKDVLHQAEHALFSSFTREVADKVRLTPQYIKDKTEEIENDLWALTAYFFEGKRGYRLDDATRTVSVSPTAEKVFIGTAPRRDEYSMAKKYQPRSGRHTVTGSLSRSILGALFWNGIPDRGSIVVDAAPGMLEAPCTIAFYAVTVKPKRALWGGCPFYAFTGKTRSGRVLDDAECRAIMEFPVVSHTARGPAIGAGNRHLAHNSPEELDGLVFAQGYIDAVLSEGDLAEKEEVERLKARTADRKTALERGLAELRSQVKTAENDLRKGLSGLEKLKLQKQCSALARELKQAEQNLFMQRLHLDRELDERIQELVDHAQLTVEIERQFIITVNS